MNDNSLFVDDLLLLGLELTKLKYTCQIFKIDFPENEMKECYIKPFSYFCA